MFATPHSPLNSNTHPFPCPKHTPPLPRQHTPPFPLSQNKPHFPNQADGFADDSVRMIKELRRVNPNLQILLFSATFNERVKRFATKIVPGANEVFVPKEKLSLDVIKQYRVVWGGGMGGVYGMWGVDSEWLTFE